ncbi:MAG: hypothetical protein Q4C47_01735 [Planctomycetia bacterium]|nr:hypothetical protein [Planctomycetia bacterium]
MECTQWKRGSRGVVVSEGSEIRPGKVADGDDREVERSGIVVREILVRYPGSV